ncbi:hypothetical protein [Curtobacterium sp. PhB115]|nr:hypothetical protein [Curtobacterium sp. PhB115]
MTNLDVPGAAFPLDDIGVQVKVDVDGRALRAMHGHVADLLEGIRLGSR